MLQSFFPLTFNSDTHFVPSSEGSDRIDHILNSDDNKIISSVILPIIPSPVT